MAELDANMEHKHSPMPLLPGATLGMIGGGQLGRYFVIAARKLGYEVAVLDPAAEAPAMQLATHPIVGGYDDEHALAQLVSLSDAITIEFENVPYESLAWLSNKVRVAPSASCARIAQDRRIEKRIALDYGLTPCANATIESSADVAPAVKVTGLPAIVKTATQGYDGKGQVVCNTETDVLQAFESLKHVPCVLEQRIDLAMEVSVVLCRSDSGDCRCFPIAQNVHVNGILHTSTAPANIDKALEKVILNQAIQLANGIEYVGVLGVEFFIDKAGAVYFNEMAPRPHNSGHYTLDATATCQFEQQVSMLCGLPAGSAALLSPVTMLNILGDSWSDSAASVVPDWQTVLSNDSAKLHLYGKAAARPGRKMGHVNCLSTSAQSSLEDALQLADNL